jgi:2-dehydro-3-deoxyphosphogluconate aldolase/(4S)-4-hydroxy-2-oxoglutarate aldolase
MTLAAALEQRVLPVVTIEDAALARPLGEAVARAGARSMEITFRTRAAATAIEALAGIGLTVGAGTVLTRAQVDEAVAAGARFVVTPGLDADVVARCRERDVPVIPGVATASELSAALRLGLSVVKLFPAEILGGTRLIQALAAPFPDVRFVPTGGLDAGNAVEYLKLPQVAAVGGSWMVAPRLVAAGEWAAIEELTRAAIALGLEPYVDGGISGTR